MNFLGIIAVDEPLPQRGAVFQGSEVPSQREQVGLQAASHGCRRECGESLHFRQNLDMGWICLAKQQNICYAISKII